MVKSSFPLRELLPCLGLVDPEAAVSDLEIQGMEEIENAQKGHISFLAQEKFLSHLKKSAASVVVVDKKLSVAAKASGYPGLVLESKDAMLALARVSEKFSSEPQLPPCVHPLSSVSKSAKVSSSATISEFVSVGEEAEIGANCVLHPGVRVGARCKVGAGSVLFPGVVLYQDVILGERVRVHANSVIGADGFGYVQEPHSKGVYHRKIHHLGGVVIGNDVEIGASTTIDRGTIRDTTIGDGTIIDNQVQIGHNCQLGKGVIICGCVAMAGSVTVEDYALVAGFTALQNKVTVGAGAQVAGFSAVTNSIPRGEKWGGNPIMPRGEYARLLVLFKRLPELFERKREKNGN